LTDIGVIPPTLKVHEQPLPSPVALWMGVRNNLSTWPRVAFEAPVWRRRFFGSDILVVSEPQGVRHVLNEAADRYRRPALAVRALRALGGQGLFLAEGADWRRQRKMLSPVFTPGAIALLVPHFVAAAEHLLRQFGGSDNFGRVNLAKAFQDTALEAVLRALFSLPEAEQRARLGSQVRSYFEGPGKPGVLDVLARNEGDFPFFLRARRKFAAQWSASVGELVATRRAQAGTAQSRDLLDLLLAARDGETGARLADGEIRDQCSTLLVAGFETTARTLFWTSTLLALDPAEQERIRVELAPFPPERLTCNDDLAHWPRLRLALLESMRLYPPAPHMLREATQEDSICGERIEGGMQVWISPWVIHRHRRYWDRPEQFRPDRFAGKTSPGKNAPWTAMEAYLPFGSGPRICIGAAFAFTEAQIVLAHLLTRYRVALSDAKPVLPVGAVTIAPSYEPRFTLLPV
jgi:cytochrome P450